MLESWGGDIQVILVFDFMTRLVGFPSIEIRLVGCVPDEEEPKGLEFKWSARNRNLVCR